jgi:hypothetical protein
MSLAFDALRRIPTLATPTLLPLLPLNNLYLEVKRSFKSSRDLTVGRQLIQELGLLLKEAGLIFKIAMSSRLDYAPSYAA